VPPYASDVKLPEFGGEAPRPSLDVPGAESPADTRAPGDPKDPTQAEDPAKTKKGPQKPQGQFTLFTIPPGATVSRGRTELGKTPLVNYSLPAGNHLLTVVGADGKKRKLSVPVEAGKKQVFKFNLDELPDG
jgi:serine/threonine-protein kinase